jgi:cyclopropane-fatty-acyl-phospholipid synthase
MSLSLKLAEKSLLPDSIIRLGIRQLLKDRIKEIRQGNAEMQADKKIQFIHMMNKSPIAVDTDLSE